MVRKPSIQVPGGWRQEDTNTSESEKCWSDRQEEGIVNGKFNRDAQEQKPLNAKSRRKDAPTLSAAKGYGHFAKECPSNFYTIGPNGLPGKRKDSLPEAKGPPTLTLVGLYLADYKNKGTQTINIITIECCVTSQAREHKEYTSKQPLLLRAHDHAV